MTVIIGLTGSIASGKSTVAKMIQSYNLPIVDADQVARQVVEPGSPTLLKIAEVFGQDVISEDGTMDRAKVGSLIFHDESKRQQLNAIIHPAIREEMIRQRDEFISYGEKNVFMDIPLLFESKLEHFVEKIIVVSVTEGVQLERLMERNDLTEEDAKARIGTQIPVKDKEALADAVIYNNGSLEDTALQLQNILYEWNVLK
ncbi:dephospho-CoA kinase [Solibacillus sp. Sa1YVA6]|uniref:Dephospho-CoA kinase n=1 Tax=Solibacillus merdavium TaxID=2762218 RepID=A0ABR8XK20_9BACL|nr:dephospho-CoA kinase [Solibacillus merdavium]